MSVDRLGIHLGGLTLTFFGLFLIAGLLVAGYLARKAATQREQDPDNVIDALTWMILAGIIGARIFHIFAPPPTMVEQGLTTGYYLTHPFDLTDGPLAIWSGGLHVLGALVGGVVGLRLYTNRRKLAFLLWADIVASGALLGLGLASLGNIFNAALRGPQTTLPWGIAFNGVAYHPLPVYLALWCAAMFFVHRWLTGREGDSARAGSAFVWMAVLLAPGMFLFELLRAEKRVVVAGLSGIQLVMLVVAAAGLFWLNARRDAQSEM